MDTGLDDLINELKSEPNLAQDGPFMNKLLAAVRRPSAVRRIEELILSSDERLVEGGAWLASELGSDGSKLLRTICRTLPQTSKKARFWSLDCILLWAGVDDGPCIGSALKLIEDSDRTVRWKAMSFLERASIEQLLAGTRFLEIADPNSRLTQEMKWLVSEDSRDSNQVVMRLRLTDATARKIAVAAAARQAPLNDQMLRDALRSPDDECAAFARDMLELGETE